jgi:hypothetical protein
VVTKKVSERRRYLVSFSRRKEVKDGESISNPTVESSPAGLTIGTPVVSTVPYDGVGSGKGVLFWIEGGAAGVTYTLQTRVDTSGGARLESRDELGVE